MVLARHRSRGQHSGRPGARLDLTADLLEDSHTADKEDNNDATDAGAVYVFVRSGIGWSQQAYLKASNAVADDRFGWSVDIDGDTLVVGAALEKSGSGGVDAEQSDNSVDRAPFRTKVGSGGVLSGGRTRSERQGDVRQMAGLAL